MAEHGDIHLPIAVVVPATGMSAPPPHVVVLIPDEPPVDYRNTAMSDRRHRNPGVAPQPG
jgi:hypothetical protein